MFLSKKITISVLSLATLLSCAILIIGGGIYIWQKLDLKSVRQTFQQQISVLQNQVNELQTTNNLLQNQLSNKNSNQKNIREYELIDEKCNAQECLFSQNNSNYVIGIATLNGYYTKYLDKAWGEEKYCDALTITGGTKKLIDSLIYLIDIGNTVHKKNKLNQPIVNFNLNNLNNNDKQKILTSTKGNPVKLTFFQPLDEGRAVDVCFSMFDILKVN